MHAEVTTFLRFVERGEWTPQLEAKTCERLKGKREAGVQLVALALRFEIARASALVDACCRMAIVCLDKDGITELSADEKRLLLGKTGAKSTGLSRPKGAGASLRGGKK